LKKNMRKKPRYLEADDPYNEHLLHNLGAYGDDLL